MCAGKAETDLSYDANLGRISSYNDRVGMYLNHRYTEAISHVLGQKVRHSHTHIHTKCAGRLKRRHGDDWVAVW